MKEEQFCRQHGCSQMASMKGFCRRHYIKNWKLLKMVEIHGNSARLFKLLEDDTVSASEYLEIMASGTLNFNERDTKSADLRRGDNIRDLNFDEGNSNYF